MAIKIDSITAGTVYTPTSILTQEMYNLEVGPYTAVTAVTSFNLTEVNNSQLDGELKTYKLKARIDTLETGVDEFNIFLGIFEFDNIEVLPRISNFQGTVTFVNYDDDFVSEFPYGYYSFPMGGNYDTPVNYDDGSCCTDLQDPTAVLFPLWIDNVYGLYVNLYAGGDYFNINVGIEIDIVCKGNANYYYQIL